MPRAARAQRRVSQPDGARRQRIAALRNGFTVLCPNAAPPPAKAEEDAPARHSGDFRARAESCAEEGSARRARRAGGTAPMTAEAPGAKREACKAD